MIGTGWPNAHTCVAAHDCLKCILCDKINKNESCRNEHRSSNLRLSGIRHPSLPNAGSWAYRALSQCDMNLYMPSMPWYSSGAL